MQIPFIPFLFFVVACINSGIGCFVLLHQYKARVNQAFFVFSLGTGLWIGGFGLLLITHQSLFISILNLGGVLLLGGLLGLALISAKAPARIFTLFYIPLFIGAGIALYPGLLIKSVSYTASKAVPVQGSWFPYYSIGFALYTFASIGILIIAYKRAVIFERKRFQYFFLGMGIFIGTTALCDIALPALGIFDVNFAGPFSSVISLGATAYAIVRHRLMDIRVVIQRSLIYMVLLGLILGLYALLAGSMEYFFTASENIDGFIAGAVTTVISSFGIPILVRFFRKVTDPIFFKNRYSYAEALERLSDVLNSNLNLDTLIPLSLIELEHILRPEYTYFVQTRTNDWFTNEGLLPPELRPTPNRSDTRIYVVDIKSEKQQLGEFILGPKRSGDPYSEEDCILLRTFTSHATVALQKAELYQQLREHTDTLEEKVEERTQHLKEIQAQQREFFDDISHALQTPLTVLKGGIELITLGRAAPDTKVYKSMQHSVDDLSQIIRNILELTRIGTTTQNTEFETFDLSSQLSRILEYVSTIVKGQDVILSEAITPSLEIYGNQKQINEVITNLLSNAVRYTEHCPKRAIHVSLTCTEDTITLTVQDSGIGIAATELEHLFDRYYRATSGRSHAKGYGLGLAISKRIISSHCGSIKVESELGVGTNFIIQLPLP
ncbi:MAG: ATP-binding protein [Candidatus Paceibacterota bacterium]